jgi:hypothetical protein
MDWTGVDTWMSAALPSDWASIRSRWELYHGARRFISLAGFGSAMAAVVWSREGATT